MEVKSNPTVREAHQWASIFLDKHHHRVASAQHYCLWLLDWDLTQWVLRQNQVLTNQEWAFIQASFVRIVHNEPIQYIVGYQDFMGLRFKVTPDTLIPREETAGLIHQLWDQQDSLPDRPKILDIGTGTGIIPIIIKKYWPQALVTAVDISQPALEVAKHNANTHQVAIEFKQSNLLASVQDQVFDVILSNPPYIGRDEEDVMDESVKQYEPDLALYADNHGLAIYQHLAEEVAPCLTDDGRIFLEVGYRQGKQVESIFRQAFPKAEIQVNQDFNCQDRYIMIHRKENN